VRTEGFGGAAATLSLAFFAPDRWLETGCLATSGQPGEIEANWRTAEACGRAPTGAAGWTLVEASLPPERVPTGADRAAFVIDAKGGGQGQLWIDDLDLWQPAGN